MSEAGFAHLHVRSGFSYGYGVAWPEEMAEAAAKAGMGSLAITDRDGLYGVPRFLEAADGAGLPAVVGAEITVELRKRQRGDGGPEATRGHVVLLADSMAGYRSLCKVTTAYRCSSEDRRRPACPLPTLLEHARGLVCLTGAVPYGLLPRLLLSGRGSGAARAARDLCEAFGEDLYAELSDDRTAGSRRRIARVAAFAREHGLPALATNEVTYLRPEDHRLHEVISAAANLSPLPPPEYRPTDQLYLKGAAAMGRLFADHPEALSNAASVAERCAGAVRLAGHRHMPAARLPEGVSAGRRLVELAVWGARKRYRGSIEDPGRIKARLRRELSCIKELGFAPYFLVAHEAAEIARDKGIPVTGRGSAANSVVCYALGLTQPEPFRNRLLFERFMHELRSDAPDIDLDFCSLRRDEIRDELKARYEEFGTAVAATAAKNSLKGAVRIAARALGHSVRETNALSRSVPARFRDRDRIYRGLEGWEEVLREPQMRGHPLQDRGRYRLLLELAASLNGRLREPGTHLEGMVIGNHQYHLSELVPLEPSGQEGLLRCQYDKDGLEYCGIPKLDILGLRMHTALAEAGELASSRLGEKVNPYDLPPDDKETYRLIRTGRNAGMFQLESPGQMHLSRRLKPRRFQDLVASISLFRPGPVRGDLVSPYVMRRNGLEPYSAPLPELLDEVLRPTYGVMVYQEQVLEVCHRVAGFSLAEADGVRRAMTKDRGPGAMRGVREEFVGRAVLRGVPEGQAEEVFGWIEGFAAYGFSAAHAASFAEISYASAYMKRHFPAEFFAGLLNAQPMGFYSPRTLVNEARRMGISILPPDVHRSGRGFSVEEDGGALRVGLRYARHVTAAALDSILEARKERPFASVADLYRRTRVERDGLRSMVRAGFLDELSDKARGGRTRLLAETAGLPAKGRKGRGEQGELPLPHPATWWAAREDLPEDYLPPTAKRAERMEWEALALNVRRHPLAGEAERAALGELGVRPSAEILSMPHGTRARAAGLLESLQRPPTRSGRPVYFLLIEDEWGLLQCTIFGKVYGRDGHLLHRSGAFLLDGRVELDRRRGHSFLVDRIRSLSEALSGREEIPSPRSAASSGALVKAQRGPRRNPRRGRKAG
ncbi:MAG: DNA polymerase III subunit alpha [Actinomycetota bacterium]|nr:DNA polymerase III subunit alpha [Actinomycetota bacterium]